MTAIARIGARGGVGLGLVVIAVLAAACATPTAPVSDEERCLRYGGHWQVGGCKAIG